MSGAIEVYCNAAIQSLIEADRALTHLQIADSFCKTRYGQMDTYRFDAIPEIEIKGNLERFDSDAVLVTEELGSNFMGNWPKFSNSTFHPTVFFCDPTDRSAFLAKYLESFVKERGRQRVGEVVGAGWIQKWEEVAGSPASITGAFSAITCIRRGNVAFSVLLNYITQEIIVACSSEIRRIKLGNYQELANSRLTFEDIMSDGEPVDFPSFSQNTPWDSFKYFTTFLGKKGYLENFKDSKIFVEEEETGFLRHQEPGGPARILYLSSLQPKDEPIGFILANGEKITEWIHWLPFIRFARHKGKQSLRLFEVFHERPWVKDGVLMATPPIYSIFQGSPGSWYIDLNFLRRFPNPSKVRSTLVVAPLNNEWISNTMEQFCYREIVI